MHYLGAYGAYNTFGVPTVVEHVPDAQCRLNCVEIHFENCSLHTAKHTHLRKLGEVGVQQAVLQSVLSLCSQSLDACNGSSYVAKARLQGYTPIIYSATTERNTLIISTSD